MARQILAVQVWQHVDGGRHVGLQNDVIVPIVLPINLVEINALFLDSCPARDVVVAREEMPDVRLEVAQCSYHAHVVAPPIRVVLTRGREVRKRQKQHIFIVPHRLPRKLGHHARRRGSFLRRLFSLRTRNSRQNHALSETRPPTLQQRASCRCQEAPASRSIPPST